MTHETDDPRRRILIQALTLGAFSTSLATTAAFGQSSGARPRKLPPDQSIYRIDGEVKVNDVPAEAKTIIKPGDTVTTGKGSEVIFVVGAHSMIVRANSKVIIERAPEDTSLIVRGLQLLSGALLSVSRNSKARVRTRVATIGIRGTGFYIEAEEDRTYFCNCYGTTDVSANDDPESRETINAKQHDKPVYILAQGEKGKRIRNAPFMNHTDQELALIETLVGRSPPFMFPKSSYGGPRVGY